MTHPQGFQDFLLDKLGVGLTGDCGDQQFDQHKAVAAIHRHLPRRVLEALGGQHVPNLGGIAGERHNGEDVGKMDAREAGRVVEQHPHGDVTPGFVVGHAEIGHVANQRGIEFYRPSIDQDHRGDRGDYLAAGGDAEEGFRGGC